ncbi:hypothetical protein [Halomonas sp. Mc5H-6]|uniref:hypothetical protein n=1 Tax=Halomonas sp. Mc5H-6 TaxID=2954500 RepID=UPI002098018A|nr:hypothetical protein [Halomonas sp. Mc5H-6]MCO7246406.1 hypothetical protein [Halomonas sp. Mc5H-6]
MKPRILKKLSKKTLAIYAASPRRDMQSDVKRAWIDDEFEHDYRFRQNPSPKEERQHREGRVSVNHVHSIGGEWDSWAGEGTDVWPFYEYATDHVFLASMDWEGFSIESDGRGWPESNIKGRLTGKKVIERLHRMACEVPE